ncbi:MAG: hypothetical protein PSX37_00305 [bacterium]|nr:hypothetical protein [bacterium]
MGIVLSLLLIAVGAILKFAVTADADGINLGTAGVILMIVGGVGVVLSLIFWASWGGFGRRTTVVESAPAAPVGTTATTVTRQEP